MDSVNWIYLRAVIQIDRWHVFKDTHEGVDVSEDLKTTSCKDCNLSPNGSVKTKACSSTRLLIWVHIWEAGSQALTAPPPPVGSVHMSVLSLDCLEGKCSNQEWLWHQVQDQHQFQCLTYGTLSLIWALKNWCHPVDTAGVNTAIYLAGFNNFIYSYLWKNGTEESIKRDFLGRTRAHLQYPWQYSPFNMPVLPI